jgi:Tfp pilus assembly protein PilZ
LSLSLYLEDEPISEIQEDSMNIKVILACQKTGKAKQAYINAAKSFGVEVDTVSSLGELHKMMIENFYNGVMVDFRTKMKASNEEKDLVHDIFEQFPAAQLNFEEKTGQIRSFHYGRASKSESLESFIKEECRSFIARPIRASQRKKIHFNVLLPKTGGFTEEVIHRTVTMNVSEGGCFIYSVDDLLSDVELTMVFKELEDQKPILGEVRWKAKWGEAMQIPGIGIKFQDIKEGQLTEIYKIIGM